MAILSCPKRNGRDGVRAVGFAALGICVAVSFWGRVSSGSTPVITLIQTYGDNQVLIHFDTDANRTYTVQYTDSLTTTGAARVVWSNLYTAPLLPFSDHYVVPDTRTTPQRFYRLQVTP